MKSVFHIFKLNRKEILDMGWENIFNNRDKHDITNNTPYKIGEKKKVAKMFFQKL